jgi:membrane-associated phospholipid phosphatase
MIRGTRTLAVTAVLCAVALLAEGLVSLGAAGAHSLDARTLAAFMALRSSHHLSELASVVAGWTPAVVAAAAAALTATALLQRRRAVALAVAVAIGGSVACAELLKRILAEPRPTPVLGFHQMAAASWPSGHATAAMVTLLCALLVAAPRLRPVVATAGGAGVLLVGCSMLVLGHHFPSDILGGFLLAGLWMALTLCVLRRRQRAQARVPIGRPAAAIVGSALAALAAAAALGALGVPVGGALLAATATLALVAATLSGGMLAALRSQRL